MRAWLSVLTGMAVVSGAAGLPGRAAAWGKDGHPVAGKVANKFLSTQARNAIEDLLSTGSFSSLADGALSNWADAIRRNPGYLRKYPKMAQWHFIDVDVAADLNGLNLADFCSQDDCALGAIKKFQAVLKDADKPRQDRREALFFIVHFVEDIHQPLHCADKDNDRGGNLVRVHYSAGDRHVVNLHKVWDTELVEEAMGRLSQDDFANRLANQLSRADRRKYQEGKLEDWILESHKLARAKVYKDGSVELKKDMSPLHTLSADYIEAGTELVEEQLTKAGVRLAKFLNDTFKD